MLLRATRLVPTNRHCTHSGNSTVKEALNAPPEKTLAQKWDELPSGAKIAVYASAAGVGAALLAGAILYCIRQRRRGAREARAAEARAEAERLELERFKKAGVDPDSFVDNATEYNAKDMRDNGLGDNNSYSVPASPVVAASPLGEKWDSSSAAMGAMAGAAGAGAGAMRSPMPLLRDGAQSPRVASPAPSPGMYSDRAANNRSPAPSRHMQSPAPSMTSPTQRYAQQPPHRSFTSPDPQMRRDSPAPSQREFGGMHRSASPAQLAHPQPQRSFTTGGYGGGEGPGYGGHDTGYGSGGNQGYWGNGGGYR